jgi:hypothetical protein
VEPLKGIDGNDNVTRTRVGKAILVAALDVVENGGLCNIEKRRKKER